MKNGLAPVNRIPPEILTNIVPDTLDRYSKDKDTIALTHVCQAWREIFISCSSLWTDIECVGADKTRTYLERSRSSPISLRIKRDNALSPHDPFLEIDPRTIRRLRSVNIRGTPENMQDITAQLHHPAPLLVTLTIETERLCITRHQPMVTTALFDGDLSSLRELHLYRIGTELPWRGMVNLASFTLSCASPDIFPITQLLDFFENAPHLREVTLSFVPLFSGDQNGRLVSLTCLKKLIVYGSQPAPLLFDRLLIPVGVDLQIGSELHDFRIEDHLPSSLNNLRNLSNFTLLQLRLNACYSLVEFTGPNGKLSMTPKSYGAHVTVSVLESLARFDTSTAERLEIFNNGYLSEDLLRRALFPMKNLRSLMFSRCGDLRTFIRALDPDINLSNTLICPHLEEFILRVGVVGGSDVESVAGVAAARASRGAKLKFVRLVGPGESVPVDVSELVKHVEHVEHDAEDVDEKEWYW